MIGGRDLHIAACEASEVEVAAATVMWSANRSDPNAETRSRIAVGNLVSWIFSFAEFTQMPVLTKGAATAKPRRGNVDDVRAGLRWARHRVAHGDADVLELHNDWVPGVWDSLEVLWDDPEVPWDAVGMTPTLRFASVPSIPGDRQPWLKPYFDMLVGERVVGVARAVWTTL